MSSEDKNKGGAPEGNTNAKRDNRLITNVLRRVVTQDPDKIRDACVQLLDRAAEGDLPAFREIFDRLDGKPVQAVEVSAPDEDVLPESDIEIARKLAFALHNAVRVKAEQVAKDEKKSDAALH